MAETAIKIRGHHLLCMLGFRGLGYSEDFVSNMAWVVDCVMHRPGTMLELTASCDAICSACPHISNGTCTKSETPSAGIVSKDIAILSYLGYAAGTRISAGDVYGRIASAMRPSDIDERFCVNCGWRDLGYCAGGLSELQERMGL